MSNTKPTASVVRNESAGFWEAVTDDIATVTMQPCALRVEFLKDMNDRSRTVGFRVWDREPTPIPDIGEAAQLDKNAPDSHIQLSVAQGGMSEGEAVTDEMVDRAAKVFESEMGEDRPSLRLIDNAIRASRADLHPKQEPKE